MNINQKQQVTEMLDNIKGVDINQMMLEAYPNETDFTKISIGKYTATEMISLLDKMTSQLRNELDNGLNFLLPFTENFSNDFGSVSLFQDLNNIYSYIGSKQFDQIEVILDRLIHYQIKNGFWNKSSVKAHSIDQEELKKQKAAIELNHKALSKNIENYEELKSSIDKKVLDFDTYVITKKEELVQIATSLATATNQLSEINTIVASATNKETEIKGILTNLNEKIDTLNVDITEYQEEFEEIKINSNTLKEELTQKITEATEKLLKAREDLDFIESNRAQIETLTGMAADGALGSKFDQRQIKLEEGLTIWKWAIPVMTILAGAWIVVVFKYLVPDFKDEWVNILVSIIKTSPGFILLGFVFSQYKKERNLQEEYAFKSAVAMTLTAYSEMLSNSDKEDNISRQQMLLKSIEMVYNQPQIHQVKNDKLFSFSTKDLKETVVELNDTLKSIKNN